MKEESEIVDEVTQAGRFVSRLSRLARQKSLPFTRGGLISDERGGRLANPGDEKRVMMERFVVIGVN